MKVDKYLYYAFHTASYVPSRIPRISYFYYKKTKAFSQTHDNLCHLLDRPLYKLSLQDKNCQPKGIFRGNVTTSNYAAPTWVKQLIFRDRMLTINSYMKRGSQTRKAPSVSSLRRNQLIFGWFAASQAQEFGRSLARFFIDRMPRDTSNKKNKSIAKRRETLDKMFLQIAQFKAQHKLNIYKKAKLGNAFKWELRTAGYDDEFIDALTHTLMQKL
jgi:hypothetical protein